MMMMSDLTCHEQKLQEYVTTNKVKQLKTERQQLYEDCKRYRPVLDLPTLEGRKAELT